MFVVGNLIIGFLGGIAVLILAVLIGLSSKNYFLGALVYMIIAGGYGLYIIIPSISIAVRRLHDQDKSGAFYFITLIPYIGPIIILIFMCLQGNLGINQYGEPSDYWFLSWLSMWNDLKYKRNKNPLKLYWETAKEKIVGIPRF